MHAEGWKVAIVDLRRVCAFQPSVVTDQALARVHDADRADLESLAAVTLPLTQGEQVPLQYDPIPRRGPCLRRTTTCGSPRGRALPRAPRRRPRLRAVAGPSFMQVGQYHGRHFLRDGYHRAFGLLSRGITVVPAFVRDIGGVRGTDARPTDDAAAGRLPGRRPPVLADYLDDTVSTAVQVPDMQKTVIVQALELFTPVGQRRLGT